MVDSYESVFEELHSRFRSLGVEIILFSGLGFRASG